MAWLLRVAPLLGLIAMGMSLLHLLPIGASHLLADGTMPYFALSMAINMAAGCAVWLATRRYRREIGIHEGACLAVMLLVNGMNVEVEQEGENFSADVPLVEGENEVAAVCQCANGEEGTPQMVTFTGRLAQRPKAMIRPGLQGEQLVLDGTESQPDEREGSPIVEYIWSVRPGNPATVRFRSAWGEHAAEVSVERPNHYRVEITLPDLPCADAITVSAPWGPTPALFVRAGVPHLVVRRTDTPAESGSSRMFS